MTKFEQVAKFLTRSQFFDYIPKIPKPYIFWMFIFNKLKYFL